MFVFLSIILVGISQVFPPILVGILWIVLVHLGECDFERLHDWKGRFSWRTALEFPFLGGSGFGEFLHLSIRFYAGAVVIEPLLSNPASGSVQQNAGTPGRLLRHNLELSGPACRVVITRVEFPALAGGGLGENLLEIKVVFGGPVVRQFQRRKQSCSQQCNIEWSGLSVIGLWRGLFV